MNLELLGPVESWAKEKSKQKNTKQEKEREKKPGLMTLFEPLDFSMKWQ